MNDTDRPMTALARSAAAGRDVPRPCTCGGTVQLYSVPTVAELLDMGRSSVYELITAGMLTAVSLPSGARTGKARLRVRADVLAAFVDRLPPGGGLHAP